MKPPAVFFPEKRRRFFGANLDLLTMDETIQAADTTIQRGIPLHNEGINVAKLVQMKLDPLLCDVVNASQIINVDGQGIVWGARLFGIPVPERVAGIDLLGRLIDLAARKGYSVYFLGAREHVVKKVVEMARQNYPGLKIAGWRDGYFRPSDEIAIVQEIRRSGAQILFVGITTPKKEFFLQKYLYAMDVPFAMGVGGSFDVMAGVTVRAPLWMQRAGLEWAFRLMNEPRRMWKRYLSTNLIFLWMILKALFLGKKRYEIE